MPFAQKKRPELGSSGRENEREIGSIYWNSIVWQVEPLQVSRL